MINTTCFFLLLKLLNAIAKSRQINWRTERTKTYGSIYFCKDIINIELVVENSWNSVITEVNKLKNICIAVYEFAFYIFQMQIFHIYNLKS